MHTIQMEAHQSNRINSKSKFQNKNWDGGQGVNGINLLLYNSFAEHSNTVAV